MSQANFENPERWTDRFIDTPVGKIPVIKGDLEIRDKLGELKARFGVSRMSYMVAPGLYALGNPTSQSNVYLTANYKLTFDKVRKELTGIDCWLLVLDTKGINVWCAAAKGTFSTKEVIDRIEISRLKEVVEHRTIILPMLSAPGVAAFEVKRQSGFKVKFGPVRASDIGRYNQLGHKATQEMRTVEFNLWDRAELIPMQLVLYLPMALALALILFLLSGLNSNGYSAGELIQSGIRAGIFIVAAYFSGNFVTSMLLPWIPGRSFSLKGLQIGILFTVLGIYYFRNSLNPLESISWLVLVPALSSFFAMNYTGSTTFASLSGVKKEIATAGRLQLVGFILGFMLWILSNFL